MTDEDINRLIALDQGWQWRWSAAKRELRWCSPDGHNYLLPPDYCGDGELMVLLLNKLHREDNDRFEWVFKNMDGCGPRAKAVAYVKMLGVLREPAQSASDKTAVPLSQCSKWPKRINTNLPEYTDNPPTNS